MNKTKELHKLYQNRELLVFINGQKWFDEQMNVLYKSKKLNSPEIINAKRLGFERAFGYVDKVA
jgi:hypothetical protein